MRQLLALALAVSCVAAPASSLGQTRAAPSTTSRITAVQVLTAPESAPTSATVVPAEQQQKGSEDGQEKKTFWNSIWLWVVFAVAGTLVVTVPWLIIVGMMFRIRTSWLKW